jgi:outer membrane protein OmpA-like peptidoglycan-associated protein/opacity protein-like surface antigen
MVKLSIFKLMKNKRMKNTGLVVVGAVLLLLIAAGNLVAEISMEKKFMLTFGAGLRQAGLNKTYQPWVISPTLAGAVGIGLSEETALFAEFDYAKVYNDSISGSTFKIGSDAANEYWKIGTLKLKLKYYLIGNSNLLPYFTGGLGFCSWSIHSKYTDEKLEVTDGDGNITNFSATELVLSAGVGGEWFVKDNISLFLDAQFSYLTGAGADFSKATNDIRSRAYGDIKFGVAIHFGLEKGVATFSYDVTEEDQPEAEEGDVDTDMDGVPNMIDLCPDTPPAAYGKIDEYGCPSDSDGDGIPDFIDRCPYSFAAIAIDSTGCPPDGDADEVPDDIDNCPNTPPGYPVDNNGCPIYTEIFPKRILQVEFSQSGQGIDFRSIQVLDSLAINLRAFTEVKVVVKAYTDNSLSERESLAQAEKEADKIKSFLVSRRISGERIETVGMGATDFIETNTTANGREKNHRIEVEFIY